MIKSIIIDDEPKARKLLSTILHDYCSDVEVLAECEDLPNGIKAIKKHKPDLVFLDIEMPGHSGLELLDFFNEDEIDFAIIFTTAYNEYALQAFRFSAIDYLLKPLQHDALKEAIERYKKRNRQLNNEQYKNLKDSFQTKNWEEKRIIIPTGQTQKFIKPTEIIMIKGDGAYSEIHFTDGTKILASRNLKHFEETLQGIPFFFRSHKSYLVNLQQIAEYVKSEGGYLIMKGNLEAGVSPEKIDELLSII
jgi:two-component system, LytTR family, response regulator